MADRLLRKLRKLLRVVLLGASATAVARSGDDIRVYIYMYVSSTARIDQTIECIYQVGLLYYQAGI